MITFVHLQVLNHSDVHLDQGSGKPVPVVSRPNSSESVVAVWSVYMDESLRDQIFVAYTPPPSRQLTQGKPKNACHHGVGKTYPTDLSFGKLGRKQVMSLLFRTLRFNFLDVNINKSTISKFFRY